eukprot:518705-Pelagomonas_calceolata.AAC.9
MEIVACTYSVRTHHLDQETPLAAGLPLDGNVPAAQHRSLPHTMHLHPCYFIVSAGHWACAVGAGTSDRPAASMRSIH